MVELSLILFLVSVPAVVFAGVSKGGFGSAAAFVATPILALAIDPAAALVLLLPLLMLMDVASLRAYWQQWDNHASAVLIAGAMPGVALGYLLFSLTHPDVLRFLIGLISVGFVLYRLAMNRNWLHPPARRPGTGLGLLAGAVSGFTSFISHAGGPAAAIYLLGRRLDKTTFQATTVIVFFVVNIAKLAPLAWSGAFDRSILLADLILAPVALLGVWLGVYAHHRISERNFFALTYVLLLVTGSKLIWDALT